MKVGWLLLCNGLAIAAAVGSAEGYLRRFPPPDEPSVRYDPLPHFAEDKELGYAITKGERKVTASKRADDDSLIYRVTYSIDANGMRRTVGHGTKVAFFFGCSFTFGQGVSDDVTLPQAFADTSGWRAINFGIPGYGAHQVLRLLELDRASQVTEAKPSVVIYTMLPRLHASLAAGRSEWGNHGPHYEVVGGSIEHVGAYENNFPMPALLYRLASRSQLYRKLIDSPLRRHIWPQDRERLLQIVLRARYLVERRDHARFIALIWDLNADDDGTAGWIASMLKIRGADVVLVSEIAPELSDKAAYYIAGDGHPTGKAYVHIANELVRFIAPAARSSLPASQFTHHLVPSQLREH